jgi:hypothetical protein
VTTSGTCQPNTRQSNTAGREPKGEAVDGARVWASGQQCARTQRAGRYVQASMAHPAKMLPAIAAQAIATYSRPGDLVADPMCGIGTTLIEAIHQGRHAIGVEHEPRWATLARANISHAITQRVTGHAEVITGDARHLPDLLPRSMIGRVRLVVTSPPYGAWTHGHVRASRDSGRAGIDKTNHRYTTRRVAGNLAYQDLDALLVGFTQILSGCRRVLAPGGTVAVTIRPIRVRGELIDLPARVGDCGERAGLVVVDRIACLLCAIRGGRVISRASFFQMHEVRKARTHQIPLHCTAHEDLIILRSGEGGAQAPNSTAAAGPIGGGSGRRAGPAAGLDTPDGVERRCMPSGAGSLHASDTVSTVGHCSIRGGPAPDTPSDDPIGRVEHPLVTRTGWSR